MSAAEPSCYLGTIWCLLVQLTATLFFFFLNLSEFFLLFTGAGEQWSGKVGEVAYQERSGSGFGPAAQLPQCSCATRAASRGLPHRGAVQDDILHSFKAMISGLGSS